MMECSYLFAIKTRFLFEKARKLLAWDVLAYSF